MKYKVEKPFLLPDGRLPEAGEVVDLSNQQAERPLELGYISKIHNPTNEATNRPALSIPVKSGGSAWFDVTLWPPRPDANEKWKRRSGVTAAKKALNQQTKQVDTSETLHLTSSQAISLGSVLQAIGFEGKRLDAEAKADAGEE